MCELAAGRLPHAPKAHQEAATGDFSEDEYVALQRVVHRVGEAVRRTVATDRLYVLSLGSNEGNAHVHWHVFPLPPGVPYEQQRLAVLDWGPSGERVLELPEDEQAALAGAIRSAVRA